MMTAMLKYALGATVILQVLHVSWSEVTVAIDLVSYTNENGAGIHQDRCDVRQPGCNHLFTFCLDKYDGDQQDVGSCVYRSKAVTVVGNSNIIDLETTHPILLDLAESKKGVLFKVAVMFYTTRSRLVDVLVKQISIESSMLSRSKDRAVFITEDIIGRVGTRLKIRFAIYCSLNTENCKKFCEGQDGIAGHYRCDEAGNKVCLQGWIDKSTNCTTRMGTCQPGQCLNGGTCDVRTGCVCTEGYQGETCTTKKDDENSKDAHEMESNIRKTGLIAGLTVMFIILILIVIIVSIFLIKKQKKKLKEQNQTTSLEILQQQREHAKPANVAHDNPYVKDTTPRPTDPANTGVVATPDETRQTPYTYATVNKQRDVPTSGASLYIVENPNYEGLPNQRM